MGNGIGAIPSMLNCPILHRILTFRLPPSGLRLLLIAVLLSNQVPASAFPALAPIPKTRGLDSKLILIQDIHGLAEAQRSIVDTLATERETVRNPLIIGVEGASGTFDLSFYHALPNRAAVAEIADEFLAEGRIGAAVHYGLTHPESRLIGIESPDLYRRNVAAYRSSLADKEKSARQIQSIEAKLRAQKNLLFFGNLKEWDRMTSDFYTGRGSLGEYLTGLVRFSNQSFLAVEAFLTAWHMEKRLSPKQVNAVRESILHGLADRMKASEMTRLRQELAEAHRRNDHGLAMLDVVLDAAKKYGLPRRVWQPLVEFRQYIALSSSLDGDRLFAEIAELESSVRRGLTEKASPLLKQLVLDTHRLSLVQKMIRFELTPMEWEQVTAMRSELGDGSGIEWESLSRHLAPYEDFYRTAEARNRAMADRIARNGVRIAVTGGFHSSAIRTLLKDRCDGCVVLRPNFTRLETGAGTDYLNEFALAKSPLEKLFSQWKLFLAPPAGLGTTPLVDTPKTRELPGLFAERYAEKTGVLPGYLPGTTASFRSALSAVPWIWEPAVFLSLFVVGWMNQNVPLLVAGAVVYLIVYPLAHGFQSLDNRMKVGGILLASFVGGGAILSLFLPEALAVVAATAVPMFLHRFHDGAQSKETVVARAWRRMVPPVLMSVFPGDSEKPNVDDEMLQEFLDAITDWRKTGEDVVLMKRLADYLQLAASRVESPEKTQPRIMALCHGMATLRPGEMRRIVSFSIQTISTMSDRFSGATPISQFELFYYGLMNFTLSRQALITTAAMEGMADAVNQLDVSAVQEFGFSQMRGASLLDQEKPNAGYSSLILTTMQFINQRIGSDSQKADAFRNGLIQGILAEPRETIARRATTDVRHDLTVSHGESGGAVELFATQLYVQAVDAMNPEDPRASLVMKVLFDAHHSLTVDQFSRQIIADLSAAIDDWRRGRKDRVPLIFNFIFDLLRRRSQEEIAAITHRLMETLAKLSTDEIQERARADFGFQIQRWKDGKDNNLEILQMQYLTLRQTKESADFMDIFTAMAEGMSSLTPEQAKTRANSDIAYAIHLSRSSNQRGFGYICDVASIYDAFPTGTPEEQRIVAAARDGIREALAKISIQEVEDAFREDWAAALSASPSGDAVNAGAVRHMFWRWLLLVKDQAQSDRFMKLMSDGLSILSPDDLMKFVTRDLNHSMTVTRPPGPWLEFTFRFYLTAIASRPAGAERQALLRGVLTSMANFPVETIADYAERDIGADVEAFRSHVEGALTIPLTVYLLLLGVVADDMPRTKAVRAGFAAGLSKLSESDAKDYIEPLTREVMAIRPAGKVDEFLNLLTVFTAVGQRLGDDAPLTMAICRAAWAAMKDLSESELKARIASDLKWSLARAIKSQDLDEIGNVLFFYRRMARELKDDPERQETVISAIWESIRDERSQNFLSHHLILAMECEALGLSSYAVRFARIVAEEIKPNANAAMMQLDRVYGLIGNAHFALRNYETGVYGAGEAFHSIVRKDLLSRSSHADRWAQFLNEFFNFCQLLIGLGDFASALRYSEHLRDLWDRVEKQPAAKRRVEELLGAEWNVAVNGLEASARIAHSHGQSHDADLAAVREYAQVSEQKDKPESDEYRRAMLIFFEALQAAGRAGNVAALEEAVALAQRFESILDDDEKFAIRVQSGMNLALALEKRGRPEDIARADEVRGRLSASLPAPEDHQRHLRDLVFVSKGKAMVAIWQGRPEEALSELSSTIDQLEIEEREEDSDPLAWDLEIRESLLLRGWILAGRNDPADRLMGVEMVRRAFAVDFPDPRFGQTLANRLLLFHCDYSPLLKLSEELLRPNSGLSERAQINLLNFLERLFPEKPVTWWSAVVESTNGDVQTHAREIRDRQPFDPGVRLSDPSHWPAEAVFERTAEVARPAAARELQRYVETTSYTPNTVRAWLDGIVAVPQRYLYPVVAVQIASGFFPAALASIEFVVKTINGLSVKGIAMERVMFGDEEIGVPYLLARSGKIREAVTKSMTRAASLLRKTKFDPMVIMVGNAALRLAQELNEASFKNESDLQSTVKATLKVVQEFGEGVTSLRFTAYQTIAKLNGLAGRTGEARAALEKGLLGARVQEEGAAAITHARLDLTDYYLVDKELPLNRRVERALELLTEAQETSDGEKFAYRFYRCLFEYVGAPVDTANFESLAERMVEAVEEDREAHRFMEETLAPLILADIASMAGWQSPVIDRLKASIDGFSLWVSPEIRELTAVANAFIDGMREGHPERFIQWLDENPTVELREYINHMWRMTAFHAGGQTEEAKKEMQLMLTSPVAFLPENTVLDNLSHFLLRFHGARRAFIDVALAAIEEDPDQFPEMVFRRAIHLLTQLDARAVVPVFDLYQTRSGLKNKGRFKSTVTGLARLLEDRMTEGEWTDRARFLLDRDQIRGVPALIRRGQERFGANFARNDVLNWVHRAIDASRFDEAEEMILQGVAWYGPDFSVDIEPRMEEARKIREEMVRVVDLLSEAESEYQSLRFKKAAQLMSENPPWRWRASVRAAHEASFHALNERIEQKSVIWMLYQNGRDEAAKEALAEASADDGVAGLLKKRIEMVENGTALLRDHRRPRSASAVFQALGNGGVEDARVENLRAAAMAAEREAEELFKEVRAKGARGHWRGEHDPKNAAEGGALDHARKAFDINGDFEALAQYLLQQADRMISRGDYGIAQEVAHVILKRCFSGHDHALRLRKEARVREIVRDLEHHALMYATKLDADEYMVERSGEGRIGPIYRFPNWILEKESRRIVINAVDRLGTGTSFSAGKGTLEELGLPKDYTYQFRWGGQRNPSISVIGVFEGVRPGGLSFRIEQRDADRLASLRNLGKIGQFRRVDDITTLVQMTVLEQVVYALKNTMGDHAENATTGDEIIDRLLGVRIDIPDYGEAADVSFFNEALANDQYQRAAIATFLNPRLKVALWLGPPGSGKTTSLTEFAQQLNRSLRGDIVVVVSQSNYAVDNVARALEKRGIPFVRAGAQADRMADWLQGRHGRRLIDLEQLLDTHAKSRTGFVFLATNNGLINDRSLFLKLVEYLNEHERSVVLAQEEGSKATVAEVLVPIVYLRPAKFLQIGDDNQLPAFGMGDAAVALVRKQTQAPHQPFQPRGGSFNTIFSLDRVDNERVSLFERCRAYVEKFGGLTYHILRVVRRGHWAITELFNHLSYEGVLIHRDAGKPALEWEKLERDTILIVNRDLGGRRYQEEFLGREAEAGPDGEKERSVRNFGEAGEVIRLIAYYLNMGYEPSDLFLLSPYKAQNELIKEIMRMVAVLNDWAHGDDVSPEERSAAAATIRAHIQNDHNRFSPDSRRRVERLLEIFLGTALSSGSRAQTAARMYEELSSIYSLNFSGERYISRRDLGPGGLEPMTMDAVQGHENKVVIISWVRSNTRGQIGFLRRPVDGQRRINVAISRAKEKLAMVGSWETLRQGSPLFRRMLQVTESIYKSQKVSWSVLPAAPSKINGSTKSSRMSLRQAWGISLGSQTRQDRFDGWVAPVLETIIFLLPLAAGLTSGNPFLLVTGAVWSLVGFPALHHAGDNGRSVLNDFLFAAETTFLAAVTAAVLPENSLTVLLVLPTLWHMAWNRNRLKPLTRLALDSLNGGRSAMGKKTMGTRPIFPVGRLDRLRRTQLRTLRNS